MVARTTASKGKATIDLLVVQYALRTATLKVEKVAYGMVGKRCEVS